MAPPPLLSIREKREPISSLYVLKALCAFVVVACHAPLGAMPLQVYDVAVPLFFMITGYFLYSPDYNVVVTRCLRTAKRVLPLLLVLTLVYAFVDCDSLTPPTDIKHVLRWIFIGVPNKLGTPLWYLTAVLWSSISLGLFLKYFKGRYVPVLVLLFLVDMCIGAYRFVWSVEDGASYFCLTFIARGLPLISIGYLIHKYEKSILQSAYLIEAVVFSFLGLAIEYYMFSGNKPLAYEFFVYPLAASVFCVFLRYKSFGQGSLLERIGRDYSSNIYYWHMLFVSLFYVPNGILSTWNEAIHYEAFGVLYIYLIALGFSYLIVRVQRRLGISFFS